MDDLQQASTTFGAHFTFIADRNRSITGRKLDSQTENPSPNSEFFILVLRPARALLRPAMASIKFLRIKFLTASLIAARKEPIAARNKSPENPNLLFLSSYLYILRGGIKGNLQNRTNPVFQTEFRVLTRRRKKERRRKKKTPSINRFYYFLSFGTLLIF